MLIFELMKSAEADAVINTVTHWATKCDDIRAMALLGSWARGNPRQTSDVGFLFLTDQTKKYRHRRKWLSEIAFRTAGYTVQSSDRAAYGDVWSLHIHLLPRQKWN